MTSGGNNFNNFIYCKTFIMTGQPSGWGGGRFYSGAGPLVPHWRRPGDSTSKFPLSKTVVTGNDVY